MVTGVASLAWFDFQATGPNPRLDPVLEVALIVTDDELIEQTAITLIVNPALSGSKDWADRLDDTSKQRFDDNGLLRDISTGVSVTAAEDALAQTVKRVTGDRVPLCGIDIDARCRPLILGQMRGLASRFNYRTIDVLSIRRFLRDVAGRDDLMPTFADADQKLHRALSDLQDTLSEARIYREYLNLIPEFT
jgi:oligoribonuclease (3'-5' exoribonuclease)